MGKCPKCGKETAYESEFVYADNPYDCEYCECGWWANSIMTSDDVEEEEW